MGVTRVQSAAGRNTSPAFLVCMLALLALAPGFADASGVGVSINRDVYSYGDYLSFILNVSDVDDPAASFVIVDQNGTAGSRVLLPLAGESTTMTAPHPFSQVLFGPGRYTLIVEYAERNASDVFEISPSETPFQPDVPYLVGFWAQGVVDDRLLLEQLMERGILIQSGHPDAEPSIPDWFRGNIALWRADHISYFEVVSCLQYLVSTEVVYP